MGGCGSSAAPAAAIQEGFFRDHVLGPKVGSGGFAQVRAVTSRSGQQLAAKILDVRPAQQSTTDIHHGQALYDKRIWSQAAHEARIWSHLGTHKNVAALSQIFAEEGLALFLMELCDQPFEQFLESGAGTRMLTEPALGGVFKQALQGLAHIHELRVVHRDIKPDNLIASGTTLKICDFGLSALQPRLGLWGVYGTSPFMSPEMILGQRYGSEVDVWAVGVIAYVLCYGRFPYAGANGSSAATKKAIKDGRRPHFQATGSLPKVSSTAEDFVCRLLERQQKVRPAATQALQMDFVTSAGGASDALCLRPLLHAAVRAEAFERRCIQQAGALDVLLKELHFCHEGYPLEECKLRDVDESTASRLPSPASRLTSPSGNSGPGTFFSSPSPRSSHTRATGTLTSSSADVASNTLALV